MYPLNCGFVALTLSVFLLATATYADTVYRVNPNSLAVSDGYLNMRSGPGQRHSIVATIPAGSDDVRLVGSCTDADDGVSYYKWCKVQWNGNVGWVSLGGLEYSQNSERPVSNVCRAQCDFDYETAVQEIRRASGRLGNMFGNIADASIEAAKDGRRLCYRQCDRP
jgi:hypothetical protein